MLSKYFFFVALVAATMKSLCNYMNPHPAEHPEVMDCVVSLIIPFHNWHMLGMRGFSNICLVSRLSTLLDL